MFFSSGSFGESPFSSKNECNSSTRSSSISKTEAIGGFNYMNGSEGSENRWNNNIGNFITPRRNSVLNNSTTNSNGRNENPNRIQRMCLPLNISMIFKSLESNPATFMIFGIRVSSVTLVGWITHREVFASRMIFRLSDGTGGIDARFDFDSEFLGEEASSYLVELREGTLVRLVGQVIPGKGDITTYISCYTAIKVTDFSEYAYYHPIEVAYVSTQLEGEIREDESSNKENNPYLSPYSITSSRAEANKSESSDFLNIGLLQDIEVPNDVTDKIQQIVYKTLSYEMRNLKSEQEKSFGVNKDRIIKLLKPYYEPSSILSAISELESKYAVIYEALDNHYCTL
ncbi:OB-fold nucleic acid binding domain-containing protein [Cryptosporidium felis]|nr:OB-fold nucleic acid binding domain-containing protein [Cryptosporidium felis]